MEEHWKSIPDFECYEASNLGRIRSIDRVSKLKNQGGNCLRSIKGRVISPSLHSKTGYQTVSLCIDAKITTHTIHKLIASAWLPCDDANRIQINHKNGIKTDNRIDNLEWVNRSENQKHAIATGLRTAKGEKNSQSKLTKEQVLDIRASKLRNGEVAKHYNISPATVCDIQKGRSWTHI
jgi:hypothetical protein